MGGKKRGEMRSKLQKPFIRKEREKCYTHSTRDISFQSAVPSPPGNKREGGDKKRSFSKSLHKKKFLFYRGRERGKKRRERTEAGTSPKVECQSICEKKRRGGRKGGGVGEKKSVSRLMDIPYLLEVGKKREKGKGGGVNTNQ